MLAHILKKKFNSRFPLDVSDSGDTGQDSETEDDGQSDDGAHETGIRTGVAVFWNIDGFTHVSQLLVTKNTENLSYCYK